MITLSPSGPPSPFSARACNMAGISIVFGVLLGIVGGVGYIQTEAPTALIPAYFGAGLVACGVAALYLPKARMHIMHVAVLIGLVGFVIPAFRSFPKLPALISGAEVPLQRAIELQAVMALICIVYVALCVNSFIQARRRRQAEEPTK